MTASLLLLTLLAVPVETPRDTVVEVSRGDRLRLEHLEGEVHISVWEREQVQIVGQSGRDRAFRIGTQGRLHRVRPARETRSGSYRVRVPTWLTVEVQGQELDVTARGLRAGVTIRAAEGDVRVQDVDGPVEVTSVDGEIIVSNVRGSVVVETSDDDIRLSDVEGDIQALTVDGDVILDNVHATRVSAETVDGDVRFGGPIARGGHYRLSTHDGDMTVWVPEGTSADLTISTFQGALHSDFPITLERFGRDKQLQFRLGDGGATVLVEAFDGGIYLRRGRADRPPRRETDHGMG